MFRNWLVSLGLLALWDCEIYSDLHGGWKQKSPRDQGIPSDNLRGVLIVLRRASVAAVHCSAHPALNEGSAGVVVNAARPRREE